MTLFLLVLLLALAFEYINGFHDCANAIATVVSTKVLTPRQAIAMAAFFNLLGAFIGTAVATTIGQGIVDKTAITMATVLSALIGAIIWNLLTWWLGLPSSSSHALIGGLCGAALASAKGDWSVLHWSFVDPIKHTAEGLWPKIVIPMISSPILGFVIGGILMLILVALFRKVRPYLVQHLFGKLQLASAAWMGLSHGSNDAQKTMGIIALALFTGTQSGAFENLPEGLGFLYTPEFAVEPWVVVVCALTMAAGTAAGGWKIIRTMGHKMVRLQPVHGFAAETTAGIIIQTATHLGIPVSTTHVITTSIMGVGATKRLSAVKWGVVHRILWAWVLTLPISALLGWLAMRALQMGGF
ncbi:MAG TPA: inorganic phosphate transporter [Chthoniobacteraceae bacterium]|nr:inorganic phosphate transporter [Chthoniobacteraceae bacterium]